MRVHAFSTLLLVTCNTPHFSPAANPAPAQFLIEATASDFRAHDPHPARVRNVRIGSLAGPNGASQDILCGEFLPAQRSNPEWVAFATIKTSGYEQWRGAQAASLCQHSSFASSDDLASALQSRLDSLQ